MEQDSAYIKAQLEYEEALIMHYTGKSIDEVHRDYDLKQLMNLSTYLTFIKYI